MAQLGNTVATRRRAASRAYLAFAGWLFSGCSGEISGPSGTGVRTPGDGTPAVEHWSFEAPAAVEPPSAGDSAWVSNEIDAFVWSRLSELGRRPAAPASPEKLVRRVTLTLTGLLPSLEQVGIQEFQIGSRRQDLP